MVGTVDILKTTSSDHQNIPLLIKTLSTQNNSSYRAATTRIDH